MQYQVQHRDTDSDTKVNPTYPSIRIYINIHHIHYAHTRWEETGSRDFVVGHSLWTSQIWEFPKIGDPNLVP